MATRRALIPEADLRRAARVALRLGVAVRCQRDPNGTFIVEFDPAGANGPSNPDDDLDARIAAFGAS